jgi:hypothetical protein
MLSLIAKEKIIKNEKLRLSLPRTKVFEEDTLLLIESLFKMKIKNLNSLKLVLRDGKIVKEHIEPLAFALNFMLDLSELFFDFSNCKIGDHEIHKLTHAFSNLNKLRSLKIHLHQNPITDSGIKHLEKTLNKLREKNLLSFGIFFKEKNKKGKENEKGLNNLDESHDIKDQLTEFQI